MKISDIKSGKRYRQKSGNIKILAKSIAEIGLMHPVVVDENNKLVAGERRIDAYKLLGRDDIPANVVNLKHIVLGEFYENTARKNFTTSEKVDIKRAVEPYFKEQAKERQKKHGGTAPGRKKDNGKNTQGNISLSVNEQEEEPDQGKVTDIIGEYFGESGKQLEKEEKIVEAVADNPEFAELLEKIDEGKMSVNCAAQMIKRSNDHKETPELPQGQFNIILADPPWQYEFPHRGNAQDHYQTMKTDEISNIKVPSSDDSILFMWSTMSKLEESLQVMKAWGFKYRSHAIWVKEGNIGLGYYFRAQHELLLLGTKGKNPTPEEKSRPQSVFYAPRLEHSHKPDLIYDIIESMYPNRTYLELFARQKRKGWTSWGNEIE